MYDLDNVADEIAKYKNQHKEYDKAYKEARKLLKGNDLALEMLKDGASMAYHYTQMAIDDLERWAIDQFNYKMMRSEAGKKAAATRKENKAKTAS
jgi:hypothetical protein